MKINAHGIRLCGAVQFRVMNRTAVPPEIADLVARAERVKRNREIVLRTFKAPVAAPRSERSAPLSPALRLRAYHRAAVARLIASIGTSS